jgi:hypothetical protein
MDFREINMDTPHASIVQNTFFFVLVQIYLSKLQ